MQEQKQHANIFFTFSHAPKFPVFLLSFLSLCPIQQLFHPLIPFLCSILRIDQRLLRKPQTCRGFWRNKDYWVIVKVYIYIIPCATMIINMHFCLSRFFCHYGRYRNRSILAIGGTKYFERKWIYFISTLLEQNKRKKNRKRNYWQIFKK